jgi:hypothetical protein
MIRAGKVYFPAKIYNRAGKYFDVELIDKNHKLYFI